MRAQTRIRRLRNRFVNPLTEIKHPDRFSAMRRRVLMVETSDGSVTKDYMDAILKPGRCSYCGCSVDRSNVSVDHIVPLCRGGRHVRGNLTKCCVSCNQQKADMTAKAFMRELAERKERDSAAQTIRA